MQSKTIIPIQFPFLHLIPHCSWHHSGLLSSFLHSLLSSSSLVCSVGQFVEVWRVKVHKHQHLSYVMKSVHNIQQGIICSPLISEIEFKLLSKNSSLTLTYMTGHDNLSIANQPQQHTNSSMSVSLNFSVVCPGFHSISSRPMRLCSISLLIDLLLCIVCVFKQYDCLLNKLLLMKHQN